MKLYYNDKALCYGTNPSKPNDCDHRSRGRKCHTQKSEKMTTCNQLITDYQSANHVPVKLCKICFPNGHTGLELTKR